MKAPLILFAIGVSGASSAQSFFSSAQASSGGSDLYDSHTTTDLSAVSGTVGTLVADATGLAGLGELHAYAHGQNFGGSSFSFTQGYASFGDMLTITGGTGTGSFLADWTVEGTVTTSGTASASVNMIWPNLPNGVPGGISSGSATYSGVFPTTFTYGVPFSIGGELHATITFNSGGIGEGTANFSTTATLTAIHVLDSKGNPVPGLTVSSASGHVYPQANAVPEPASLLALAFGLPLLRRRRNEP